LRARTTAAALLACAAVSADAGAAKSAPAPAQAEAQRVRAVIADMQDTWNRGDFVGYMNNFARTDLVFVGDGIAQADWRSTLDHYVRAYDTPARRGRVSFYNVRVTLLAPGVAQAVCDFRMDRPETPLQGVFTDILRKRQGRWVVTLNHVSSRR
jgi:ketosteroid isomerase-like protein